MTELEQLHQNIDAYTKVFKEFDKTPKHKWTDALKAERLKMIAEVEELKWAIAMRDAWCFVKFYGRTQDEHDVDNPFKPFIGPQETEEDYRYFQEITKLWQEHRLLIIPKSRQLRVTWLFCHLLLWDALAHQGRRNGMQTKNEMAASALIDRVEIIMEGLPPHKSHYNPNATPKQRSLDPPILRIPHMRSVVWGLPEGTNVGRSFTFTHYFIDEAWMQKDLRAAYTSAKPATVKLTMVCSAPERLNQSAIFFNEVADDIYGLDNIAGDVPHGKIEGYEKVEVYRNRNGFVRARTHYTATAHRFITVQENGRDVCKWVTTEEWKKHEEPGYGRLAWNREQEISFESGVGNQVFETTLLEKIVKQYQEPLAVGKMRYNFSKKRVEFVPDVVGPLKIYEYPQKLKYDPIGRVTSFEGQYACGVDPAGGLSEEGDPSVLVMGDKRTKKITAVLSMHKTPRAFAFHVWMLAVFYNNAFVVPEANTYGASMIECLRQGNAEKRQEAYTRLYRPTAEGDYREKERTRYGWYMTKESKLRAIDEFGEAIRDGQLIINAREVGNEMRNYIEFEDSEKLGAVRGNDDLVIGAALMHQGIKREPYEKVDDEFEWKDPVFDADDDVLVGSFDKVTGY